MENREFIPNFINHTISGEISNRSSFILQHNDLEYISFNKSINIWNFKTFTLVKTIFNKKYSVSFFCINDKNLFIGFSSGLIRAYRINNDFEKFLEYKIHNKKIISIIYKDNRIISASSDGLVRSYSLDLEIMTNIAQFGAIDTINVYENCIGVSTGNCNIEVIENDSSHTIITKDRLKFLSFLDKHNLLLVFKDNSIQMYNYKLDKYKDCKQLKKIKAIKRFDDNLYILSSKKLFFFVIKRDKEEFCLVEKESLSSPSHAVDFSIRNKEVCYVTCENSCIKGKIEICFHKEDIFSIRKDRNNRICSISKDKMIIWNVQDGRLVFYNKVGLFDAKAFEIYLNYYVIVERDKITFIDINSLKVCKTIEIEEKGTNNICIASVEFSKTYSKEKNNVLGIAINQKINLYNENIDIVDSLDLQDFVSCFKIYNNFFIVALLNSKVYIYENNKDLYKTLYGHSLPVTNINISDSLIYTIAADKMLKIWGLDFGDCRKSIIANDSSNIQIVSNNLFVMGGDTLKYYKGFKMYHEKKNFDNTLLLLDNDFLVATKKNSLSFFEIDQYEFDKINEESSDAEVLQHKTHNIVSISKYENFLNALEDKNFQKLNKIILEVSLGDFDSYAILLNVEQIFTLVDFLFVCENTVVAARIFVILISKHKEVIVNSEQCNKLRCRLLEKIQKIRNTLGKMTYKIFLNTLE